MVRRGFRRLMPAAAVGILVALLVTSAEATVGPSPGAPALRPQPQTAGQAQESARPRR